VFAKPGEAQNDVLFAQAHPCECRPFGVVMKS
jgi:hypothetical protein